MRVVIAPDSFKECATAAQVAEAIASGWRRAMPEADLELVPMADGGEGTVAALVGATRGSLVEIEVTGPLGEPVKAAYGLLGDGKTAAIEMAAASGLALVPPDRRDPRRASTRGTGELMRHALDHGIEHIVMGIGGSATNDAGAGMAQALSISLRDADETELPPGGAALARLATIDAGRVHARLEQCRIEVACDVRNPLYGTSGAAHVYAPQKGATPEAVAELDEALRHFADIVEAQLGVAVADVPGAGAAGGLGAGLMAFAGAALRPGVAVVAEACGLAERLAGADLVITGEGRLDDQTIHGKTPVGVARIAKEQGIPVIAIAGTLGTGYEAVYDAGIDAAFSICNAPVSLPDAMARTEEWLAYTAEAAARLWRLSGGIHASGL